MTGTGKGQRKVYRNRIVRTGQARIADILFSELNWRIHPKLQQEALHGVLEEIGFVQDVLINLRTSPEWGANQNVETLVDGHLRVLLADKHGEEFLPAGYVDLTPDEERKVLLTLDPLSAMAAADKEKLDGLLRSVSTESQAVQAMLAEIAEKEGIRLGQELPAPEAQIDKAAELQEKWQVKPGDIFEAADQRLICGDCTDRATVERLMRGAKAALSFTSPPYWVGKEYEAQKSVEEIEGFIARSAMEIAQATREDESRIVINTSTGFTTSFDKRKKRQTLLLIDKWTNAFWDLGWNLRHIRHWIKEGQLASISAKADMIDQHCEWFGTYENDEGQEMVFEDRIEQDEIDALLTYYNARGRGRGQESLGEYRNAKHWALRSYWDDIPGTANQDGHVAVMPLEIAERHLVIYTQRGEIVLDPFLGSGTTLVGCARLGRRGRGIEIYPPYVSVALQRLQDMGLEVKRVEDGHSITSPP